MMRRFYLALVLLIFAAGCADKQADLASRQAELLDRLTKYHECVQWRDYETAALFVVLEKRPYFLTYAKSLPSGYTISDFLIKQVQMSPEADRAAAVVSRSFIRPPSITLQSEEILQEWVANEDGVWFLSGPPY